jgi:hypothetical protein
LLTVADAITITRPRVYLETSFISYLAARRSRDLVTAQRQLSSQEWWELSRDGFALVVSSIVLDECSDGDPAIAARRQAIIAEATFYGCQYLLTWNFRHIANAQIRRKVDNILRSYGYEPPIICTPDELANGPVH